MIEIGQKDQNVTQKIIESPANRIQTSCWSFSSPTARPSKIACKLNATTVKKSLKALFEYFAASEDFVL